MTVESTVPQQHTITGETGNFTQTVTFQPFAPSLGTLVDVEIGVTSETTGIVPVENLPAAPATVGASIDTSGAVYDPAGTMIGVEGAQAGADSALGAFDGTIDYVGNSGTIVTDPSASNSELTVYQPGTSRLELYSGTSLVALGADRTVSSLDCSPGGLQTLSRVNAGAVSGDVDVSIAMEGPATAADVVGETMEASLSRAVAGSSSYLVVNPATVNATMFLGAYYGVADFAGSSGRIDQGPVTTASGALRLTGNDLALFTGTGTLDLSVAGSSSVGGSGDLLTRILDQAGATVLVEYV